MFGIELGPTLVASSWEALLHPSVRALQFGPIEGVDCSDCRMVRMGMFNETAKCCTWVPTLPNFLVGEILVAGQREGSRERVADWVRDGRGDPLFLNTPPRLVQLHREAGQMPLRALPCPLLGASGQCTIYAQRPYLCVGYSCTYPAEPAAKAFWLTLASLMALHSAITAHFVAERLGIDRTAFSDVWEQVGDERTAWSDDDRLSPELQRALWQGRVDPAAFYRACFDYVRDHAATVRQEADQFRRAQLVRQLHAEGRLTKEREREILEQSTDPSPATPPVEADVWLRQRLMTAAEHRWTIPEHEGWLLGYHRMAFSEAPDPR